MHIINPWVFYLADICDSVVLVGAISGGILVMVGLCLLAVGIYSIHDGTEFNNENEVETGKQTLKYMKTTLIVAGIMIGASILIPSKETIYKMMLADVATYENVDLTAESIEEAFDHIIDKLCELKGDSND